MNTTRHTIIGAFQWCPPYTCEKITADVVMLRTLQNAPIIDVYMAHELTVHIIPLIGNGAWRT